MSLTVGAHWKYKGINIEGLSLSGIRTAFAIAEHSLGFDVAQGYPFSIPLKHHFISHAHMDHAAGIPYIISQKAMNRQPAAEFYLPSSQCEGMTKIMRLWEQLENHTYQFHFHPVTKGFQLELNKQFFVKAFPTVHRIESFGYTLFERTQKLRPEFLHCSREEILQLKAKGEILQNTLERPLFSFTGDTQIEFLEQEDWIKDSQVLFLEATYLDTKKSVAHAREWGHTHLDEILPRLKDIRSEKIVLIHSSSRYSWKEAQSILKERLPANEQERVLLFPGR